MKNKFKEKWQIIVILFEWLASRIMRPIQRLGNWLAGLFGKVRYERKGSGLLSIAVCSIAGALLVWLGFGIFSGMDKPIQTVQAVEYTAHAGHTADGYIVREEKVLLSPREINSVLLAEGQKTAAWQPVAVGYTTLAAQQQRISVSELESELEQLNYAGSGSTVYDQALMDGEIQDLLLQAAKNLNRGDFAALEKDAPYLKGLVLRRYSTEEELATIRQQAENTKSRIRSLQLDLTGSVEEVLCPAAGYFSAVVDGFETLLTPATMTTLSVDQFRALAPQSTHERAVGKLITGDLWYYLCAVPQEQLKDVQPGDTVAVRFGGENHRSTEMKIVHMSQQSDGQCVIALSTDRYMPDMTGLRQLRAEVIFRSYSGLRIPKQAVRVDDRGKIGVYVLEGPNVTWKTVELLYDNGESYIVRLDKSSTDHLWPGDEVIVSAAGMFEGKVVF